ncbi:peptidoglycan-binding domain-containing protein [Streptomyces sp. NPDC001070]
MASDTPGSPASHEEHEYESLRVRPYVPGPGEYEDVEEPVPADVAVGAAEAFPLPEAEPSTQPVAPEGADEAGEDDTDVIDLGTVSSDRLPVPVTATSRELVPYPSRAVSRRRAGAHRRRRGAVIAGTGLAAVGLAVGAVFVTAQLTGIPDRTEAAPDQGTSEPAVELPPSERPSASASRSASPSVTPSTLAATRGTASATAGSPTPSATASLPTASASGQVSRAPSSSPSAVPATLQSGDSGPAVVDLQNRLKQMHLYYGPSDGDYDRKVRDAVARFQFFYGVQGDPEGVYGPNTRAALESKTGATQDPDSGGNDGHGWG